MADAASQTSHSGPARRGGGRGRGRGGASQGNATSENAGFAGERGGHHARGDSRGKGKARGRGRGGGGGNRDRAQSQSQAKSTNGSQDPGTGQPPPQPGGGGVFGSRLTKDAENTTSGEQKQGTAAEDINEE
ncbi:hypothetical protein KC335_g14193, partial [Hortaea werneckii]